MPAIGLPVESVTVTRTAPAKPKPNKRRAHVSIDKRYAVGRRYKQLVATFRERLGLDANPDTLLLTAISALPNCKRWPSRLRRERCAVMGWPKVAYDDVVRLSRLPVLKPKSSATEGKKQKRFDQLETVAANSSAITAGLHKSGPALKSKTSAIEARKQTAKAKHSPPAARPQSTASRSRRQQRNRRSL